MPSTRHYSGTCPSIPRLTYLPLQRWQFFRRVLLSNAYTSEVRDTGPGIPPHNRDTLFLPYFSTKKYRIGLEPNTLQRIIVDRHDSIVLVTEEATLGTTLS